MVKDISKVLFSKEEIYKKVKELGTKITQDYEDKDLVIIGVLTGSIVFVSDLIREIDIPLEVSLIKVSSYGNSQVSSGIVKINQDTDINIEGKDVLIVEDIIDTGLTLKNLVELLTTRKPKSINICTMFDKPERRKVEIDVSYIGLKVPDEFIVGYGLDYAGKYRNLPYIGVLKAEIYAE